MNAPLPTQLLLSPGLEEEKLEARVIGKDFVKAILTQPFEPLPTLEPTDASRADDEKDSESGAMRLWRNIPDLESDGEPVDIVLRSIAEPFWQSCIDAVENLSGRRYRVCAVGTPGIGKSYTTPLLLRMLLLKGSPVVYIRHSVKSVSWYYEFIPPQSTNNESGGNWDAVTVNVYPEEFTRFYDIPSLKLKSTYYVVDPGETKESCDPGAKFKSRVIIVTSPDEKHWGGGEFIKRRGKKVGVFHFYPVWNLTEVLRGLEHFSSDLPLPLSRKQLAERYREVGGVPRHLFAVVKEYKTILKMQDDAVKAVTKDQAQDIVSGKMDTVGVLSDDSPKSAVVGISLDDKDDGTFTEEKAVPISTLVAEKVFIRHIQDLWKDMVENEQPLVFESYLRTVLTKAGSEIKVQHLKEKGIRTLGLATDEPPIKLPSKIGGYSDIQIVPTGNSIVKAAIDCPTPNILFYSANPNYKLIDFACKDENDRILAFQATTSQRHKADVSHIKDLEDEVGNRVLILYYLHPARPRFNTIPVKPTTDFCRIFHVKIPKPIKSEA